MQRNVDDVMKLWESGKQINTIQLESEGSSQEDLHDLAFAMVKAAKNAAVRPATIDDFRIAVAEVVKDAANTYEFTPREIVSAESLAFLTMKHGWSVIVSRHHDLISLIKEPPKVSTAR